MQASLFDAAQRDEFWSRLRTGEKMDCPCCGRYSQMYKRALHYSVAVQLIEFHKMGGSDDFVSLRNMVRRWPTGIGDFTKAKYWELIMSKDHVPDAKKTSGLWMLTSKGTLFVLGLLSIPKYAIIFDDEVRGMTGEYVTIKDCLTDKFNYTDLMNNAG